MAVNKAPHREVSKEHLVALREQNNLISPAITVIAGEIGRVRGASQKLNLGILLQEIGKISRASLRIGLLLEEWEKRRS